jgi:hypothetical protein
MTLIGLLTQKADSPAPTAGQKLLLKWQQRTGASGKTYNKVNNANSEEGQLCQILKSTKTDYEDAHGNVSFNIEFTPVSGGGGSSVSRIAAPAWSTTTQDDPRHYLMRCANLLKMTHDAARAILGEDYDGEDARTLFIQAARAGMVAQMPDRPMKEEEPQPEPGEPAETHEDEF